MTTAAGATAYAPLILGGSQAVLSGYGAYEQNKAVKSSMGAARRNADVQIEQLTEQGDLERRKRSNEAQMVRSRLRVLASDSGFDSTGSWADLERQVDIDERIDLAIISRNAFAQKRRVQAGLLADLAKLSGDTVNPLTKAFLGGLGGYATGLQIKGAGTTNTLPPGSGEGAGMTPEQNFYSNIKGGNW